MSDTQDNKPRGKNVDLDSIKNNLKEVYDFISEQSKKDYIFVGIRYDYINLYYFGGSACKIEFPHSASKGDQYTKYTISTHNKYITMDNNTKGYKSFNSIDEFKEKYDKANKDEPGILEKIKSFQETHTKDEKICQQWIINKNNADPNSPWYYLDMEYTKENCPTGRFDMIAISKYKIQSQFKVALVELKVGDGNYSGISKKTGELIKKKYKSKDSIYELGKEEKLNCGSGITGHMINFIRFLNDGHYETKMKNDIIWILKNHKQLGLIDNTWELSQEINPEEIGIPDVYIVSYNNAPEMPLKTPIDEMKKTMHKYLFSDDVDGERASDYALETILKCDAIDDLKKNLKGDSKGKLLDNEKTRFDSTISIGRTKKKYHFHFVFIDNSDNEQWNCLESPS